MLQLRDAGELSLDDPLTAHIPESAHGPTLGRLLAHSSGLQREPPGEIWETMQAPSREELVALTADAEQILAPGTWWHYSNLAFALLGEVVAARKAARGRTPCGSACWSRSGWRGRRRPLSSRPRAATSSSRTPTRSGSSPIPIWGARERSAGSGRPRSTWRAGARSSPPATTACWQATLEEMAHVRAMVDHERWKLAWGTGLELYRSGDRVFAGHGGAMPGHLAGLVVDRTTGIGAAVLTNTGAGARPEELALELAAAAIEAMPAAAEGWRPGEPAPPEIAPLLGAWWSEGYQIVFSWRGGRLQARLLEGAPGRDISYFERLATIAGAASRAASAASCCASCAARTARSRSSTSRRTRSAASPRPSAGPYVGVPGGFASAATWAAAVRAR